MTGKRDVTKPPRALQCECGKLLPDERAHVQHKKRFGRKGHRLVRREIEIDEATKGLGK